MKPLHAILVGALLLRWCTTANAQHSPTPSGSQREPCSNKLREYEDVLDAYFVHVHGNSPSLVALRVHDGLLPEYEIVIDAKVSSHKVFRYVPAKSIWWNVYSLAKPHLPMEEYKAEALKIPSTKNEFEIPQAHLQDLLSRASALDISICEQLPLKDSGGRLNLVADGAWFEIIAGSGNKRARVTDTSGSDLISQNPALLQWALDLQKASEMR